MKQLILAFIGFFTLHVTVSGQPVIYANQIGYDANYPKIAVIGVDEPLPSGTKFFVVGKDTHQVAFSNSVGASQTVKDWATGKTYYQADFSTLRNPGKYTLVITIGNKLCASAPFIIRDNALAHLTISSIIHYYNKQRANTPAEIEADEHMHLIGGGDKTVDVHGGWCDASGDVSKYFSHLAYANFMSPQQTPLVVWSMVSASEGIPGLLEQWNIKDSLDDEALYGADYIMRSLSPDNYFYMTVFSYFNKDPHARRIVGLHANSVTTDEYQAAFREGGGMAIAALARISRWKKHGEFTSEQYLDGAKRAFAHLLKHNLEYDDDHKENIIDDYHFPQGWPWRLFPPADWVFV